MNASLNKKLKAVKWGEYRLGDLFEINPTKWYKLTNEQILSENGTVPLVSNSSTDNGVMGFSNLEATNSGNTISCSDTTLGAGTMYYQKDGFIGYQHIQHLVPKFFPFNQSIALYIISVCRVATSNAGYDYAHKFNRDAMNSTTIHLPQTSNGKIDFDFMESFVAELSAYLEVSGLDNYELSSEEKNCLLCTKVCWKEYRLGDLFDIFSYKKRFDANKVTLVEKNGHPYIVRQGSDNGQKGLIKEDEAFLNDGNTISFGQDTATMFYQEKAYFTGDKIKILKPKFEWFGKENAQFFLASMHRSFSSFSWGSSSFSKGVIENQKIYLPTTGDDRIDFNYISVLISAIQKLVIKDVVQFTNRKLDTYKNIVSKSSFRYQIGEQRSMIVASADETCLDY